MAEAKKTSKSKIAAKEPKAKLMKAAEVVVEAASLENPPEAKIEVEKPAAKAGKRSPKSLKATEEKQAKQVRKATDAKPADAKSKTAIKPAKTRAARAGKRYREATKLIDKSRTYNLKEAVELAVKTSTTKFDAALELHVNLDVDPKQADQNVRGSIVLPAGTGKASTVAAFVEDELVAKAKSAGADLVGQEELMARLDKEQLDFDILISTPTMMAKLGKYARLLGPRGLMPNPKSGTVTVDIEKAIKEAKAGKIEYRVDQSGIIHLAAGKVSFGPEKLLQNCEVIMASIRQAKPASLKGTYLKSAYTTTSMGPSIRLDV